MQIIRVEFITTDALRHVAEAGLNAQLQELIERGGAVSGFTILPEEDRREQHETGLARRQQWVQDQLDRFANQMGRVSSLDIGYDTDTQGRYLPHVRVEMVS